jgi:hypothetical protein
MKNTTPKTTISHDGHRWVVIAETLTAQVLRRPRVSANPTLGYVNATLIKPAVGAEQHRVS